MSRYKSEPGSSFYRVRCPLQSNRVLSAIQHSAVWCVVNFYCLHTTYKFENGMEKLMDAGSPLDAAVVLFTHFSHIGQARCPKSRPPQSKHPCTGHPTHIQIYFGKSNDKKDEVRSNGFFKSQDLAVPPPMSICLFYVYFSTGPTFFISRFSIFAPSNPACPSASFFRSAWQIVCLSFLASSLENYRLREDMECGEKGI